MLKSKILALEAMRSGLTDFGITEIPFWIAQRRRPEQEYVHTWFREHTLHHCQGKHLWQAVHKPEPEFLPTGNIQSVLSDSKADDIRSG